jgi:hypothetical protein
MVSQLAGYSQRYVSSTPDVLGSGWASEFPLLADLGLV